MRWQPITAVLILAPVVGGCDKLATVPLVGRFFTSADSTAPAMPAVDTAAAPDTAPSVAPPPAPAPEPVAAPPRPMTDEPWNPVDTGTVSPGMSREQVIAVWGVPVAERQQGDWHFLYFRNGCEVTCGTFDVVFLQQGQVVDAVVRGPGHTYQGASSSPTGRQPEPTPPTTATAPNADPME